MGRRPDATVVPATRLRAYRWLPKTPRVKPIRPRATPRADRMAFEEMELEETNGASDIGVPAARRLASPRARGVDEDGAVRPLSIPNARETPRDVFLCVGCVTYPRTTRGNRNSRREGSLFSTETFFDSSRDYVVETSRVEFVTRRLPLARAVWCATNAHLPSGRVRRWCRRHSRSEKSAKNRAPVRRAAERPRPRKKRKTRLRDSD